MTAGVMPAGQVDRGSRKGAARLGNRRTVILAALTTSLIGDKRGQEGARGRDLRSFDPRKLIICANCLRKLCNKAAVIGSDVVTQNAPKVPLLGECALPTAGIAEERYGS